LFKHVLTNVETRTILMTTTGAIMRKAPKTAVFPETSSAHPTGFIIRFPTDQRENLHNGETNMTTKAEIEAFAATNGIDMTCEFIPFSKSRSFVADAPISGRNLNWKVTLRRNGRDVLTCDYSAGMAYAPSYEGAYRFGRLSVDSAAALKSETESGFAYSGVSYAPMNRRKPILPELADVLHSLALDSSVLDYPTFESWAGDSGYDTDSRKGEATYRACLSQSLALRAGLGEALLSALIAAVQDY
jgi:hypothetical protein